MDVIGLAVPVQFDGIRMNPFGMYSAIGKDTRFGAGANNKTGVASGLLPVGTGKVVADSKDNHGNAWWGGLSAEMTLFSPLRVAVDGVYGKVDMGKTGNQDLKRARAGMPPWPLNAKRILSHPALRSGTLPVMTRTRLTVPNVCPSSILTWR